MNASFTYEYEHKRCYDCGTRWAIESWRNSACLTCPHCGGKSVTEASARYEALEKTVRSLRGAITTLKRRK